MTLFKRPDSSVWWTEFEFQSVRYRRSTETTDRKVAKDVEKKLRAEVHAQVVLGRTEEMSFGKATASYWTVKVEPDKASNLSSTFTTNEYRMEALLTHFGKDTKLSAITGATINAYKAKLLGDGKTRGTFNRHLGLLLAILNYARKELHALAEVPEVSKEREPEGRVKWLHEDEEAALLDACKGDLRDLVLFLMDTGGRRGDALQLQWSEVHLEPLPGFARFEKTKTDKPRSVPLTKRVREMLLARKEKRSGDAVFPYDPVDLTRPESREGSRGKRTKDGTEGLRSAWEKARATALTALRKARTEAAEKAGTHADLKTELEGLRMHDLRHHFASRLAMKGQPLYNIGELLGHKKPNTTKRYAHLQPKALEASIDALN